MGGDHLEARQKKRNNGDLIHQLRLGVSAKFAAKVKDFNYTLTVVKSCMLALAY